MCALFFDTVFGEDKNHICVTDCCKSMGDCEYCSAFCKFSSESCTIFSLSLSSAEVASSRISIGGFLRILLRYLFFAFDRPKV